MDEIKYLYTVYVAVNYHLALFNFIRLGSISYKLKLIDPIELGSNVDLICSPVKPNWNQLIGRYGLNKPFG